MTFTHREPPVIRWERGRRLPAGGGGRRVRPRADPNRAAGPRQVAWLVGGVFVLLSLPISVSEGAAPLRCPPWRGAEAGPGLTSSACPRPVYQHLTHFEQPELQTYIVRILWMVPVYGIESWFSLRYFRLSIYMATLRELCGPAAPTPPSRFRRDLKHSSPCLRSNTVPRPVATRRTSSTASSPSSSSTSAARRRWALAPGLRRARRPH